MGVALGVTLRRKHLREKTVDVGEHHPRVVHQTRRHKGVGEELGRHLCHVIHHGA